MIIHKNRIRYDINSVRKFVSENSDCELLSGEYIKNTIKLDFRCQCGNEFEATFAKFKNRNKRQCNNCGSKKRNNNTRLTIEQINEFAKKHSDCQVISKSYKDSNSLMEFVCGCGNLFTTTFGKFKHRSQRQCLSCSTEERVSKRRKTHDEFTKEIKNIYGDDYTILSEYENDFSKVEVRHNVCGREYIVTPSNILRNRRCPNCASSKGEEFISRWLEQNDIDYSSEYSFPNLTSDKGRVLRFDFAILEQNNIKLLIEFDGGHHFKHIKGWNTKEQFETVQKHDKLKNEYCKNKNIKLIRIPHWEFDNLDEILENALL